MSKHAENQIYLIHIQIGFSLFNFTYHRQSHAGSFGKFLLRKVNPSPAFFYEISQSLHYMHLDINYANISKLYVFKYNLLIRYHTICFCI